MTGYANFITKEKCVLNNCAMFKYCSNTYYVLFNGNLYNSNELKAKLSQNGFETISNCLNEELLVYSYILYGYDVISHLDGVFSFVIFDSKKNELFLARDHFGTKPLYYYMSNHTLYFSSTINDLFQEFDITPVINEQSVAELFGIGPAHTPGLGMFKNIFEIKPGHYAIYNKDGLYLEKYWSLKSKPHTDNLEITAEKTSNLLENAINKQLSNDPTVCTMLSGGLDSSIITDYANKYFKSMDFPTLKTFSVDYLDNDKNFVQSDFQPNSDNYYIDIMKKIFKTNHTKFVIDTPELASSLKEAMLLRGYPGMADVDSSLLLFCKKIKAECNVAISGECSDEVFAGYPWFFREDSLNSDTFPWSLATVERQKLLNPDISKHLDLKEYVDYRYKESLENVEILNCDSSETKRSRKISHLTFNWFMQTLLDRADRMSNGLEIRVPFCDYKLVEYVWNIPWNLKALNGREKGLLRYIIDKNNILPKEIVERKKSPYPKTHNPNYLSTIKNMLIEIMNNPNSPIHNLVNDKYVQDMIDTNGNNFSRPWFGQLMTGPQLMAYLVQINMWLEEFRPVIEI